MIEILSTFRCNNNCIMCPSIRNMVELKEKEIIKKVKNSPDEKEITITGGEPTIRKDLLKVLFSIKKINPELAIKLITNARLFSYKEYTRQYLPLNNIEIITEIHGSEAIHDKITRAKNSFRQTIEGIKNINHILGIKPEVRIVISKINYGGISEIIDIVEKEQLIISQFVLFPIAFAGRARRNFSELRYTYSMIMPYVEKFLKNSSKKGHRSKLYHFPFCVVDKEYRSYLAGKTTEYNRLMKTKKCKFCKLKKGCSLPWKSYVQMIGDKEFNSIKYETN